jgi:3-phenylpropionate/cinnamic acid dioxygenase small subunit
MSSEARETALDRLVLKDAVEQFFQRENDLLDTRQYEAWLGLLSDDIRYWMPLARNQAFGDWDGEWTREGQDLNWFDEGKFELEQRVNQLMTGLHWAEEPVSRTCHMFANLQIRADDGESIHTHLRFIVYRNRTEIETDFYVGKRNDVLRRVPGGEPGGSFKIAAREIFLDQNVLLAKNLTTFF